MWRRYATLLSLLHTASLPKKKDKKQTFHINAHNASFLTFVNHVRPSFTMPCRYLTAKRFSSTTTKKKKAKKEKTAKNDDTVKTEEEEANITEETMKLVQEKMEKGEKNTKKKMVKEEKSPKPKSKKKSTKKEEIKTPLEANPPTAPTEQIENKNKNNINNNKVNVLEDTELESFMDSLLEESKQKEKETKERSEKPKKDTKKEKFEKQEITKPIEADSVAAPAEQTENKSNNNNTVDNNNNMDNNNTDVNGLEDTELESFMEILVEESKQKEKEKKETEERREKLKKGIKEEDEKGKEEETATTDESTTETEKTKKSDVLFNFQLSPEQEACVEAALRGESILITGGAGTGKSLVLQEIVFQLKNNLTYGGQKRKKGKTVYVTAMTGVAALNIRGTTLHHFAALGYKAEHLESEKVMKQVRSSRKACGRIAYADTLIIDEVSMMKPHLFDVLNDVCKTIRRPRFQQNEDEKDELPFGGIQIILCGDFMQLPPVGSGAQYVFHSKTWAELAPKIIVLQKKFRQEKDLLLQTILDEVRFGELTPKSNLLLLQQSDLYMQRLQQQEQQQLLLGDSPIDHNLQKSKKVTVNLQEVLSADETEEETITAMSPPSFVPENTEKFYVRLCATNAEVDSRNAKFFASLEPKTDMVTHKECLVPTLSANDGKNALSDNNNNMLNLLSEEQRNFLLAEMGTGEVPPLAVETREKEKEDDTSSRKAPLHFYHAKDIVFDNNNNYTFRKTTAVILNHNNNNSETNQEEVKTYGFRFEDSKLPTQLPLKVKTRVMLLHNVSTTLGLVNGSVGEVRGFLNPLEMIELILGTDRLGIEYRKFYKTIASDKKENRNRFEELTTSEVGHFDERLRQLMQQGGYLTVGEVLHTIDSHHMQSLYYWIRTRLFEKHTQQKDKLYASGNNSRSMNVMHLYRHDEVSYQDIFGKEHLNILKDIVGWKEELTNKEKEKEKELLIDDLDEFLTDMANEKKEDGKEMLYPGGLTPQGIQQLRLPIILFDIPSQANQDLIDSLEKDEKNNLKKGTLAKRKKPLPPCVCLYLSPTRVDWYSGAAAGTTVSEDEANLKKTEDDEDSTNTKKKKDTGNNIIATRWQLPLRLAWAVTVHKSQGLTIPKLEIDMKKFFSPGQAYVALSRGKELKDIHVLHYSINAIRVCPVAKQFYKDLEKNKQPGVVGVYYKNQYSDQLDREKEQQEKEVEESESFLVGLLEDAMEASETTVQQQNEKSDEGTATTEKKGKGGKKKKKTKKVKEVEVEEESPLNSVLGEAMEVHNNNNNSVFSLQPPAEEDDEILDRSGKKKKEKTKNKKTEKKTTPKKSAAPADKKKNEEEESPLNSVLGEAMEVHNNNNIFHSSFSLQPPTEEDDRLDRSVKSNKKSKRPK